MHLTGWITLVALGIYMWTGVNVGRARVKYGVNAPLMDGPLPFQSALRVQGNTLEQLPLLLAPMWMCAALQSDTWAAAGGAIWCVGRVVYALAYYADPAKRSIGFGITMTGTTVALVGAITGMVLH